MPRYRNRPIIIEVNQWFPGKQIPGVTEISTRNSSYGIVVTIQDQEVRVNSGDWVIKESDGIHNYSCTDAEFQKRYELNND